MRDGFREIVAGWAVTDDIDVLNRRLEDVVTWTDIHGPWLPDEDAVVRMMMQVQFAHVARFLEDLQRRIDQTRGGGVTNPGPSMRWWHRLRSWARPGSPGREE